MPRFGQLAGRTVFITPTGYHPNLFTLCLSVCVSSIKKTSLRGSGDVANRHSFLAPPFVAEVRGTPHVGRTRFGNKHDAKGLWR